MTKEEARGLAAQAWCTKENETTVMDPNLAEAFADILLREVHKAEGGEFCESCGKVINTDDENFTWEDGVVTCEECGGPEEE